MTEERSWIQSWIRIHYTEVRIRGSGSGSAPKCYGSATLLSVDRIHARRYVFGNFAFWKLKNKLLIAVDFLR
jgi:hypothetical protein